MQSKVKHSSLPFKVRGTYVYRGNQVIANLYQYQQTMGVTERAANGNFIVRACNSYYEMLDVLREIVKNDPFLGSGHPVKKAIAKAEETL